MNQEALFSRRHRLDSFGKFTGDVPNQGKFRIVLKRRVGSGARSSCGRLRAALRVIRGRWRVGEKWDLPVRRKTCDRVCGRTKAVDARNIRVSEQQESHR